MSTQLKNPFPGLRPFTSSESHLFFGRERHIEEILRKLDNFRFVSIVGNSGSGKSSLIRAGVLPKLIRDQSADKQWVVCVLRPGENPVLHLLETIDNLTIENDFEKQQHLSNEESLNILESNKLGLVQLIRNFLPDSKKLLIVVDQFEEIFRFSQFHEQNHSGTSDQFVSLLLGAVHQRDVPIYVMLTVRSDFLGDCEQFMGLPEAINDGQFLVPRMNREELQRSLTGPIQYAGGKISPRLTHELLNQIGNNPDQLPILQHVLMRTWDIWIKDNAPEQPIDLVHYEKTGGMSKALSVHAEEAYSELQENQHKTAEVLFKTITLKGPDNRGIRKPTQVQEIASIAGVNEKQIEEIAAIFRRHNQGFIMPPEDVHLQPESILDISHESLMRIWERLSAWVDEEAESAELYNRITESALLYEQGKAGLWRDPDLQIAIDWRNRNEPNEHWANQYNPYFHSASRFIDASVNDKKFAIAEQKRRRRILNISTVGVMLALTALSIWAVSERNNSNKNAAAALQGKKEADRQKQYAEEQRLLAEVNYQKTKAEEQKVKEQQHKTEEQRQLAIASASEAEAARQRAEQESEKAITAREAAERDRRIAEKQKSISDSLRYTSEKSEKKATRLSMLYVAQNLAVKSKLADKNTISPDIKVLLALQAYNYHKRYEGKAMDPEIYYALFNSMRLFQNEKEYLLRDHKDAVKSICYNSSNGDLASTGDDGKLIVSNFEKNTEFTFSHPKLLLFDNLVYNENGSRIALSCDNNSIQIFNSGEISTVQKEIAGLHPDKIQSLKWNGDEIISACLDNNVRIINTTDSKVVKTIPITARPICMDFHKASNSIIVGCENGDILKMNLKTDNAFTKLKSIANNRILCLDWDATGKKIAVGTNVGGCYIINASNGQTLSTLLGHDVGINNIRFHNQTGYVATACLDGKVRLYPSTENGGQPIVFSENTQWVMDVVFHPNGKYLASCSKDKTVRTFPIDIDEMAAYLRKKMSRNMTTDEWEQFVGADVPYEKTLSNLP
ncbi:MAG: hypothetical protein GC181_05730 [Bacteroidetes bacterium]|nr:hypothetical protein [Bacteroidota bacterium]